jgi:S1-C subfamily serine protease
MSVPDQDTPAPEPSPQPGIAPEPPAPQAWWTPPPTMPPAYVPAAAASRPQAWKWMVAIVLTWAIIAGVAGTAIGFTLARSINNGRLAQVITQTSPSTGTTNPSPLPSQAPITPVQPSANPTTGLLNLDALAAKVDPAIVNIDTLIQTANGSGAAAGTGLIVTSDGQILTNNHVVNGSTSINVTIAGHSGTYNAHVIGVAPNADVALLQVEGITGLPTVELADSSSVQVGDKVAAFGNALGKGGTPSATQGQVTALAQDITASTGGGRSEHLTNLIQSDAPIAPGDSGGALVNSAGQVIGMITAGEAQGFQSSSTNVAYSIPTNDALAAVNKIRAGQASDDIIIGPVGYLGVSIRDLTPELANQLGLNVTSGALVSGVQAGSPAEAAGITRLSVITSVEGTTVTSTDALGTALHKFKPGAKVKIGWTDQGGTSHTATATLTTGPNI